MYSNCISLARNIAFPAIFLEEKKEELTGSLN